jgi:hypothetical protein
MTRYDLPHSDTRPHIVKSKPVDDRDCLAEFHRTHWFCQACGRDLPQGTAHHIIGGRGGRSDEPCNLLYLCWEPCHLLAVGLDVRGEPMSHEHMCKIVGSVGGVDIRYTKPVWSIGPLLPKITLAIALSMKIRAGELQRPILLKHPSSVEVVTSPEWDRLAVLHGRPLPDMVPIPDFFADLYRQNRPELHAGT